MSGDCEKIFTYLSVVLVLLVCCFLLSSACSVGPGFVALLLVPWAHMVSRSSLSGNEAMLVVHPAKPWLIDFCACVARRPR